LLSRLRKLVFNIRHRSPAARFVENMRRLNRLARLMTIMQQRGRRKVGGCRWLLELGLKAKGK
jgi:hypothetical protein